MKAQLLQISKKLSGVIPALALMLALQSASSACFYFLHQPDVPDELL